MFVTQEDNAFVNENYIPKICLLPACQCKNNDDLNMADLKIADLQWKIGHYWKHGQKKNHQVFGL